MSRIAAFGLTTPDAARLVDFYERAVGCRHVLTERLEGAGFERLMEVGGGARRSLLMLGAEAIELLEFDMPGRAYPNDPSPLNPAFQHFAIVVEDIQRAVLELDRVPGWTPITTGGPQRLPPQSGGVAAYKFRDPDGHPLEFLEFPRTGAPRPAPPASAPHARALHRGIDHSAMSVRDTAASLAFYASLGFQRTASGVNVGVEQARLDGVADPVVAVTTLRSMHASSHLEPAPHLELLCYETLESRARFVAASNDVAATRIVLEQGGRCEFGRMVLDPDGHRVLLHERAAVRTV